MDNILAVLIAERDKLDRAIAALQGGAKRGRPPGRRGPGRPPGRPPGRKGPKRAAARRRGMSPAARKAASERMTAYWAARRKLKAQKQAK